MTSAHIGHVSADALDKAADRYIPIAMITGEPSQLCLRRWELLSILSPRSWAMGRWSTRTLVRHYVDSDLLERKAGALRAWDERLNLVSGGKSAEKWRSCPALATCGRPNLCFELLWLAAAPVAGPLTAKGDPHLTLKLRAARYGAFCRAAKPRLYDV